MTRWSRNAAATVVFIHGFGDTAALWNCVMVRLCALPSHLRAANLRHAEQPAAVAQLLTHFLTMAARPNAATA